MHKGDVNAGLIFPTYAGIFFHIFISSSLLTSTQTPNMYAYVV